jgi:hypothetical protein
VKLPSALDTLESREHREVRRAVEFLTLLRRKYDAAQSGLMATCTAAAKIVVEREIARSGYEVTESPGGYTWRKSAPAQPPIPEAEPSHATRTPEDR